MDDKITFIFIGCAVVFGNNYNLDRIKSKTVGDGQHGTASFATQREINNTFKKIDFNANKWRNRINLPKHQGLVVGTQIKFNKTTCYIDTDDIHLLMIGAAGVGKTAHFLYPNLEYACASGISFITTDTKGGCETFVHEKCTHISNLKILNLKWRTEYVISRMIR